MIFNVTGGGGNQLNFRVYAAASLPETGKENDVCVITETPITSWEVFDIIPSWASEEGKVYITDTPATNGEYPNVNIVDYNKAKGMVWVQLIDCYQYVSGQWVKCAAYQYRGGQWVQFSGTFSATINITYPAGSTCTASYGGITLTAPNTSGTWACHVYQAGTWTITATNGTDEDTKNVNVTSDGQVITTILEYNKLPVLNRSYPQNATITVYSSTTATIVITTAGKPATYTYQWYADDAAISGATSASYTYTSTAVGSVKLYCKITNAAGTVTSRTATITINPQYLYNTGTINTSLIGGFTAYAYRHDGSGAPTSTPTVTKGTSDITVVISGDAVNGGAGSYFTNNKIDITKFKTLKLRSTSIDIPNSSGRIRFGVSSTRENSYTFAASKTITAAGTASIDISSLSGSYYVSLTGYSLGNKTITFDRWWME